MRVGDGRGGAQYHRLQQSTQKYYKVGDECGRRQVGEVLLSWPAAAKIHTMQPMKKRGARGMGAAPWAVKMIRWARVARVGALSVIDGGRPLV